MPAGAIQVLQLQVSPAWGGGEGVLAFWTSWRPPSLDNSPHPCPACPSSAAEPQSEGLCGYLVEASVWRPTRAHGGCRKGAGHQEGGGCGCESRDTLIPWLGRTHPRALFLTLLFQLGLCWDGQSRMPSEERTPSPCTKALRAVEALRWTAGPRRESASWRTGRAPANADPWSPPEDWSLSCKWVVQKDHWCLVPILSPIQRPFWGVGLWTLRSEGVKDLPEVKCWLHFPSCVNLGERSLT